MAPLNRRFRIWRPIIFGVPFVKLGEWTQWNLLLAYYVSIMKGIPPWQALLLPWALPKNIKTLILIINQETIEVLGRWYSFTNLNFLERNLRCKLQKTTLMVNLCPSWTFMELKSSWSCWLNLCSLKIHRTTNALKGKENGPTANPNLALWADDFPNFHGICEFLARRVYKYIVPC